MTIIIDLTLGDCFCEAENLQRPFIKYSELGEKESNLSSLSATVGKWMCNQILKVVSTSLGLLNINRSRRCREILKCANLGPWDPTI